MAWRYCSKCGAAQGRLTIDEIAESYGEPIGCYKCHEPREDDTTQERFQLLAQAIVELRDRGRDHE